MITKVDLRVEVTAMLRQMGTPAHLKGYYYLRDAVLLVYDDSLLLDNMIKGLYKKVAQSHGTTPFSVERAIRNAIEITMDRGNTDYVYTIFSSTISKHKGKPTNREFIMSVVDLLKTIHD